MISSNPNYLPKVPRAYTITRGGGWLGLQHMHWGQGTNIPFCNRHFIILSSCSPNETRAIFLKSFDHQENKVFSAFDQTHLWIHFLQSHSGSTQSVTLNTISGGTHRAEFARAPLPFFALKLCYRWFLKALWPVGIIWTPCQLWGVSWLLPHSSLKMASLSCSSWIHPLHELLPILGFQFPILGLLQPSGSRLSQNSPCYRYYCKY